MQTGFFPFTEGSYINCSQVGSPALESGFGMLMSLAVLVVPHNVHSHRRRTIACLGEGHRPAKTRDEGFKMQPSGEKLQVMGC